MENETKTVEAQPVEAELITEETSISRPLTPIAASELAGREDGLVIVERKAQILTSLRRASIASTTPHDGTLYKAEARITGYLESLACWNLRPLWGVDTVNPGEPYKIEHEDGTFAWAIEAEGYCNVTNTAISRAMGICYSNEDFLVSRKLPPIKLEPEMQRTARQRLEGILVREAGGLKRVPVQELDDVWRGTWKNTSMSPKGRGFGSGAERQGAQVKQSDIETQYQPKCDNCHAVMKYIPAGTSQQGKPYDAFWACQSKEHKFTLKHSQALAEAKRMKEQQETQHRDEPGSDG